MHITTDMRLLVLGNGTLGLLTVLGLRHPALGLIMAGRHPDKLAIAAAQGVATHQVAPGGDGSLCRVRRGSSM